jgi:hypothetical protein
VNISEYNQKKITRNCDARTPATRKEPARQKNGGRKTSCSHLFAYKVEEASLLLAGKKQRFRFIGTATFPVLHVVGLALKVLGVANLSEANCASLILIAPN